MISFTNIEALRPGDEIVMSWSMYPPAGESPDGWSWAIVTRRNGPPPLHIDGHAYRRRSLNRRKR